MFIGASYLLKWMKLINLEIMLKFRNKKSSLGYKTDPVRMFLESSQIHTYNKHANWRVSV